MMTRTWKSAFDRVAGKLVAAQESERIRIARELHDDLGQQTAVLASKLDILVQKGEKGFRTGISEIQSRVQELATTIHNLSHQLHPAKLRLLGLVQTLAALCRDESFSSGVAIRFSSVDVPRQLPEDVALCLFRVAQEGVRNALKHSGATTIDVALAATASQIVLHVSDNGSGFNPLARSAGLGLLTMRERVQLVRGVLSMQPARPHGSTLRIVVPLDREREIRPPHSLSDAVAPLPVSIAVPAASPASALRGRES
jgi:signal transduction histidine kinase